MAKTTMWAIHTEDQGKPMMPSRRPISLLAAFVVLAACSDDGEPFDPGHVDILDRLVALPGVSAKEVNPTHGTWRTFELDIAQSVNHADPHGPQFIQRAYLFHVGETLPMVFAPSGYSVSATLTGEMAGSLGANCLRVSHRYYEGSAPDPLDWQYLTVEFNDGTDRNHQAYISAHTFTSIDAELNLSAGPFNVSRYEYTAGVLDIVSHGEDRLQVEHLDDVLSNGRKRV